jgi:hypothetical protein
MDDHFNLSQPWYEKIGADRLRCIIQNLRKHVAPRYRYHYLWALVSEVFGVGSTMASEMCRFAKLNPDEKVRISSTTDASK